ncbi:UNVERIFIED_CONTAM: hypothetical protein FKN15_028676 [Acipenser sinensis]
MSRRSQRTKTEPPTGVELDPEGTATRTRSGRRSRVQITLPAASEVPEPGRTPSAATRTRSRKSVRVFEIRGGGAEPERDVMNDKIEVASDLNEPVRAETAESTEDKNTDGIEIQVKSPQTEPHDLSVVKDATPTSDTNVIINNNEAIKPASEPTVDKNTRDVNGSGKCVTGEKENVSGGSSKRIKLDGRTADGCTPAVSLQKTEQNYCNFLSQVCHTSLKAVLPGNDDADTHGPVAVKVFIGNNGKEVEMQVKASDTVLRVKELLQLEQGGSLGPNISLACAGKPLLDTQKMCDLHTRGPVQLVTFYRCHGG